MKNHQDIDKKIVKQNCNIKRLEDKAALAVVQYTRNEDYVHIEPGYTQIYKALNETERDCIETHLLPEILDSAKPD